MNQPTTENPLIIELQNKKHGNTKPIPSLKNNRSAFIDKKGNLVFPKNFEVQKFMQYAKTLISNQLDSQSFDLPILIPERVCIWVRLVKYLKDQTTLPQSDLDNQYTTLQELLQGSVVEDDRQISSFYVEDELTQIKDSQYATLYLWVDDGTPKFEQQMKFYASKKPHVYTAPIVSFPNLLEEFYV